MNIGIMIEGQDGLTWDRWKRILEVAEGSGFTHVFRSDHFTNAGPPDKDSLELWVSLTYLAASTTRIGFGPLVTPVTFRHPAITARMATAVDDLSGGRLTLGIGAGWQDREHHNFGISFPPVSTRYEMLDEYMQVVSRLLRSDEPSSFEGKHFSLHEAILLPRPQRKGGPPLLIGGNGERRTLPLAAKYADEWNAVFVTPHRFRELSQRLDECLDQEGRSRGAVKRSAMIGTVFARDDEALQQRLARRGATVDEVTRRGLIVGTREMWVDQLRAYADTGMDRIMLQWTDTDDLEGLEIVAQDVLPQLR